MQIWSVRRKALDRLYLYFQEFALNKDDICALGNPVKQLNFAYSVIANRK